MKIPRLVTPEEAKRCSERKVKPVVRYSPSDTTLIVPSTTRVHVKSRPILPQVPKNTKKDKNGHLRIGDHLVSVDGTLPDLIANDVTALPTAPYALSLLLLYIRQTSNMIMLNVATLSYNVSSHLHRPTFVGIGPGIDINYAITAAVPAANMVWLNTQIDFVSGVAIATLPTTIYEPSMVGGNPSTRALDTALSNKLCYTQAGVNSILVGAYQLQPVRWDNQALYAKMWYYTLEQQVVDETAVGLGDPAVWANLPAQFTLQGAAPALDAASQLVNNIRSGSIALLENVHFTIADLQVIYSLTMAGTRFNAAAGAPQFPFQSIQWPAVSITLVYHTVAAVPASLSMLDHPTPTFGALSCPSLLVAVRWMTVSTVLRG